MTSADRVGEANLPTPATEAAEQNIADLGQQKRGARDSSGAPLPAFCAEKAARNNYSLNPTATAPTADPTSWDPISQGKSGCAYRV